MIFSVREQQEEQLTHENKSFHIEKSKVYDILVEIGRIFEADVVNRKGSILLMGFL